MIKKLVGEKTYLSPLTPEHAALWYRWHNDMETALLAASPGHRSPGTEAEYRETIDAVSQVQVPCLLDRRTRDRRAGRLMRSHSGRSDQPAYDARRPDRREGPLVEGLRPGRPPTSA